MNIRTAFYLDPMGTSSMTVEQEREFIIDRFDQECITLSGPLVSSVSQIQEADPQLVMLDYGGLSMASGMEQHALRMVEGVREWALNNPDYLVIIKCTMGIDYYKRDFRDYGAIPGNVLFMAYSYDSEDEIFQRVRAAFGLEPPPQDELKARLRKAAGVPDDFTLIEPTGPVEDEP